MYQKWLREAGYWLPNVEECYDPKMLYREMEYHLKRALECFMAEECM